MLNIFIVRHGQTDTNKSNRINGAQTDLPLNSVGIQQVQTLHTSFDIKQIDCIYASPLKRAFQTAEILSAGVLPIQTDDRLKEIDYGNWDGQATDLIYQQYPQVFDELGYLTEDYVKYCTGESYDHLAQRLQSFWQDLLAQHHDQQILLVCHGTVSRVLIQRLFHIPMVSAVGEVKNAGVINVAVNEQTGATYLRYYNRQAPGVFDEAN